MEKKMKITNCRQFETLVSELEKNPSLAKGFSRGIVPANFKNKWDEIATKINAVGPPIRDSDGWQKVWRDLKFKTKKKMAQNKAECNATGGGRFKQLQLSALEEAVASLMQFEKQLNPEGLVFGVKSGTEPMVPIVEEEILIIGNVYELDLFSSVEEPSTSTNMRAATAATAAPAKKSAKRTTNADKNNRNGLLEKHSDMQERVLSQMSQTMMSIKNNLKDLTRYQRKMVEIQEKKFGLLKRKDEREEELFQTELQLKKIKVEIQAAELEMLTERKN